MDLGGQNGGVAGGVNLLSLQFAFQNIAWGVIVVVIVVIVVMVVVVVVVVLVGRPSEVRRYSAGMYCQDAYKNTSIQAYIHIMHAYE